MRHASFRNRTGSDQTILISMLRRLPFGKPRFCKSLSGMPVGCSPSR
jgi:hypothetical protein